jgi:hypothetical protein
MVSSESTFLLGNNQKNELNYACNSSSPRSSIPPLATSNRSRALRKVRDVSILNRLGIDQVSLLLSSDLTMKAVLDEVQEGFDEDDEEANRSTNQGIQEYQDDEDDLLLVAQNHLAISNVVYIYPHLRQLSLRGYTSFEVSELTPSGNTVTGAKDDHHHDSPNYLAKTVPVPTIVALMMSQLAHRTNEDIDRMNEDDLLSSLHDNEITEGFSEWTSWSRLDQEDPLNHSVNKLRGISFSAKEKLRTSLLTYSKHQSARMANQTSQDQEDDDEVQHTSGSASGDSPIELTSACNHHFDAEFNKTLDTEELRLSLASGFKEGSVLGCLVNLKSEIVYVSDRNYQDAVYCLLVNKETKTITVAFRGSVTLHDASTNFKAVFTKLENPVTKEMCGERQAVISIHTGVHTYLLKQRKDTGLRKIDVIFQHVHAIGLELAHNGMYKVDVTGHSLGGALANAFALFASCDARFTCVAPVRAYLFGSPRIGDKAYFNAFQCMEKLNKLRCVRFVNTSDLVNLIPFKEFSPQRISLLCSGRRYYHVGLQVRLYSPTRMGKAALTPMDVSYPADQSTAAWFRRMFRECIIFQLGGRFAYLKHHTTVEHQRRINLAYQGRLALKHLYGDNETRLKSLEDYYRTEATSTNEVRGTDWRPPIRWEGVVYIASIVIATIVAWHLMRALVLLL